MSKVKIRAVLIDFGNTLVKQGSEENALLERGIESLAEYLEKEGYRVNVDELRRVEVKLRKLASRFRERTFIEIKASDRVAVLLSELGIPTDPQDDLTQGAVLSLYKPAIEDMVLYSEAVKSLQALRRKGYRLALVSNAASEVAVKRILKRLRIAKFFDAVVVSSQVGVRKPSLAIYLRALKELKVKPHEAVFIGDLVDTDIRGAKRIGMKAVLVTHGSSIVETDAPDAIVESLIDAVEVLAKWEGA